MKPSTKQRIKGWALSAPPLIVIAIFIGVPIVYGVLYTLGYTGGVNDVISMIAQHQHVSSSGGLTIGAWREVFADAQFWQSFFDTVLVTIIATAVVMVLAWLLALYMRFMGGRFSRLVTSLSVVPMFIPVVIASYAVLSFYGTDGFMRTILNALGWHSAPAYGYTVTGIILGSIWVNLPFAVLMVSSGLSSIPESLIESARDVGASAWTRFRSILLPMAMVPTVIAATFTAITILGSFTLPYIVGPSAPNLLGVLMNNTYTAYNKPQQAEVMAIMVFVLASFASVPYLWANFRSSRNAGAFK